MSLYVLPTDHSRSRISLGIRCTCACILIFVRSMRSSSVLASTCRKRRRSRARPSDALATHGPGPGQPPLSKDTQYSMMTEMTGTNARSTERETRSGVMARQTKVHYSVFISGHPGPSHNRSALIDIANGRPGPCRFPLDRVVARYDVQAQIQRIYHDMSNPLTRGQTNRAVFSFLAKDTNTKYKGHSK